MDKKFGVEMPVGKSFTVAGKYSEKVGDPTPQGEERDKMRHEPTTIQAKSFNGSYGGFQPKPAVEIIIVCMKPLSEKTFVDQALANGKGVTWLDKCRVPYISQEDQNSATPQGKCTSKEISAIGAEPDAGRELERVEFDRPEQRGRFPANLLVSDDVLNDGSNHKSGHMDSIAKGDPTNQNVYGKMYERSVYSEGDEGSFSRYFDLDKWFEKTIENLPESVKKTFPFLICPKASKAERNKGLEDLPNRKVEALHGNIDGTLNKRTNNKPSIGKNFHPTVKPLKLMSYLVTLGSRENDTILDPFIGSGTTTLACRLLNRNCVGIELEPSYVEIARARLSSVHKNQKKLGDWF
jgi:site-specific DNA-methyltransferase (adenine-specific)